MHPLFTFYHLISGPESLRWEDIDWEMNRVNGRGSLRDPTLERMALHSIELLPIPKWVERKPTYDPERGGCSVALTFRVGPNVPLDAG